MSRITLRPYEERDSDGYWHVRDMTYNDGRATPREERRLKTTSAYVAENEGQIVGCFNVLDLSCTRGDRALLKCAGIAGVAVLPECRHLGVGSEMMRWSIPYLQSQGYQVASLYGFRETFYRKFGYEVCGQRLELHCPAHRLPRLKPELPVRKVAWNDFEAVRECQKAFAEKYSGMNVRTEMHWGRVLEEGKALYVAGDPVQGYAIVDHSVNFWVEQFVNEIGWSSLAGYQSILAMLCGISINKSSLRWYEPSNSPFLAQYIDQGLQAAIVRPIMYRILDVPGTLAALKPVGAGAFSVQVVDELIPENWGPWGVEDSGSAITVAPATSASLSSTIQSWTQAYFGEPAVNEGYVDSTSLMELKAAEALLPPMRTYCQEFF